MTLANTEPKWPNTPEGYFFRVKRTALGIYPFVELRKKLRYGSRKIQGMWQFHTEFDTVVEEIEYLAGRLLEENEYQDRVFNREYWVGDSE